MNTTIVFKSATSIEVALSSGKFVYIAIPQPIDSIPPYTIFAVSDFINLPEHPFYALYEILRRANMQASLMTYIDTPAKRVDYVLVTSDKQLFILQSSTPGLGLADGEK